MDRNQELMKKKLQMWRETKLKPGKVSSTSAGSVPTTGIQAKQTKPIPGLQRGSNLLKKAAPVQKNDTDTAKNLTKVAVNKTKFKNVPKTLSSSLRRSSVNSKGVKRLSRNTSASNKGNKIVVQSKVALGIQQGFGNKPNERKSVVQPSLHVVRKVGKPSVGPSQVEQKTTNSTVSMKDRLAEWRRKKEEKEGNKRPTLPQKPAQKTKQTHGAKPKSYVASSRKLTAIIQSYVDSGKKSKNSDDTSTPRGPRRVKRPLNFSSVEASAKRQRTLSLSESVTQLATTPRRPQTPKVLSSKKPQTPSNRSSVTQKCQHRPLIPQAQNAREEEQHLRSKLSAWLKARGKTPERHRHTPCYHNTWRSPGQLASPTLDECQLAKQKSVLDHEDVAKAVKKQVDCCMERYQQGEKAESLLSSLKVLVQEVPEAERVSTYWLCTARLMEDLRNDAATVEVYDQALKSGAEPKMDILKALHNFTTRLLQRDNDEKKEAELDAKKSQSERKKSRRSVRIMEAPLTMPRKVSRVQLEVDTENIIESSAVKYSISSCTPLMKNLSLNDEDGSPRCYVVTPVRRSTRKSFTDLPKMLKDHDEVVDNLEDLSVEKRLKMLYNENQSLCGEISYDDDSLEEDKEN